jgi:hypothetical protein
MAFPYPITKVYDQIKLSVMHELLPWAYFSSHSVLIKIQSSFPYVGVGKLFAHVYCLLDSSSSLKSRLLITVLNKNGHLSSYLVLFLS